MIVVLELPFGRDVLCGSESELLASCVWGVCTKVKIHYKVYVCLLMVVLELLCGRDVLYGSKSEFLASCVWRVLEMLKFVQTRKQYVCNLCAQDDESGSEFFLASGFWRAKMA